MKHRINIKSQQH